MSNDEIKRTIDDFLSFIETGCGSSDENHRKLKLYVDQPALAQHFAECTFDERKYPDPPDRPYEELRKLVSARFPSYGFYNVAEDVVENLSESKTGIGDAIDDLADIARDLFKVKWRWENNSPEDGIWQFKFTFDVHWSLHLRELQLFLVHHDQHVE